MVGARHLPQRPRSGNRRGVRIEARTPSTRTRLLAKARESLAPHESLRAVADASARVVSAVSVAAALTAGLSLGGAVAIAEVGWGWAFPSVALSALAVVLAVWASMPRMDELHPGNLEDVDRFFTEQIRFRGRLLRASGVSLCVAFVCIPIPFIAASCESLGPGFSLKASHDAGEVQIVVDAEHVDSDATISVIINSPEGARVLGHSSGAIRGAADVEVTMLRSDVPVDATIVARLLEGGEITLQRSIAAEGLGAVGRLLPGQDRHSAP